MIAMPKEFGSATRVEFAAENRDALRRPPPAATRKVFAAATSQDLATAKKTAAQVLLALGCMPVEETEYPSDYSETREMLRADISECDAVLHIAGFHYGMEPEYQP